MMDKIIYFIWYQIDYLDIFLTKETILIRQLLIATNISVERNFENSITDYIDCL